MTALFEPADQDGLSVGRGVEVRRQSGELSFGGVGIEVGLVFAIGKRVGLGEGGLVDVEHGFDDRTGV